MRNLYIPPRLRAHERAQERAAARRQRLAERGSRAINQRRFDVGPQPARWPAAFEVDSIPDMDPARLIRSTISANKAMIALTALISTAAFAGTILIAWALGIVLDSGIERGLTAALVPGLLLLIATIGFRALGAASEPFLLIVHMRASVGWVRAMILKVAGVRGGGRNAMPSGEIVAAATTDNNKLGGLLYMIPEMIAATVSFILAVVLMLRISVPLGLVVAIGLPVAIGLMTFLIKPLQERLNAQREERGKLTTLASDAVVGLRVLRGVGGEDTYIRRYTEQSDKVRDTGIRVAGLQAFLMGLASAVPGVFTAIIVGSGLWQVYNGTMSYGDLVAFYGYTSYMVIPIHQATGFFSFYSDAKVAADRIGKVMAIEPLTNDSRVDAVRTASVPRNHDADRSPAERSPEFDWASATLRDGTSGVEIRPGRHTVLVAADPDLSADLLERLARTDDENDVTAQWPGGEAIPLHAFELSEVRKGIVLSDAIAQLFQGRLRSNLEANNAAWPLPRGVGRQMGDTGDGSGVANRDHKDNPIAIPDNELMLAMIAADGSDIVQSLEDGLDGYVAERGRSLSGGQRQRVALARALLTQAPVLLLVEPSSAVDSHTEARIASRLHAGRRNRTTVAVTASPIMLGEADEVIFLGEDGKEAARGTHAELLDDPRYHAVVHRASGDENTPAADRAESTGQPEATDQTTDQPEATDDQPEAGEEATR